MQGKTCGGRSEEAVPGGGGGSDGVDGAEAKHGGGVGPA